MQLLSICGSSRETSKSRKLINHYQLRLSDNNFTHFEIANLPLFKADFDKAPWPQDVLRFRKLADQADVLIIVTPEYIYNIPAALKNALEWLTSSGELMHKKILPIVFSPLAPRGEKALQSLEWSLTALEASIVAKMLLHHCDFKEENGQLIPNDEMREYIETSIQLIN